MSDIELLINSIQERPILWDKRNKNYYNRLRTRNTAIFRSASSKRSNGSIPFGNNLKHNYIMPRCRRRRKMRKTRCRTREGRFKRCRSGDRRYRVRQGRCSRRRPRRCCRRRSRRGRSCSRRPRYNWRCRSRSGRFKICRYCDRRHKIRRRSTS